MQPGRHDTMGQLFMALSLTATLALIHAHDQRVDTHAWVRHAADLRLPVRAAYAGRWPVCQLPPWTAEGAELPGRLTPRGCEVVLRGRTRTAPALRVLLIHASWRWSAAPRHEPPDAATRRVCVARTPRGELRPGHVSADGLACVIVDEAGRPASRPSFERVSLSAPPHQPVS